MIDCIDCAAACVEHVDWGQKQHFFVVGVNQWISSLLTIVYKSCPYVVCVVLLFVVGFVVFVDVDVVVILLLLFVAVAVALHNSISFLRICEREREREKHVSISNVIIH